MQAAPRTHDVVIIGAGSAGYAAACTVRDLGCDAALVDTGPLGGLCILRGCMPSKALLASSDALADARESKQLGICARAVDADMEFIAARKRFLVSEFADYRIDGIERFPLYRGSASFLSPNRIAVGDSALVDAPKFIVATGSKIAPAALDGLDQAGYLDSDRVLELEHVPKSVIVLGGGYTACELGQFLARLGAGTTMLIRGRHLLTQSDDDVGSALTRYFEEDGIPVLSETRLLGVEKRGDAKVVRFERYGDEREVAADEIFYALGRSANSSELALENAGVECDQGGAIRVDATLRTSNPAIYAVGDVTGGQMLVHVAIYQGEVAARNACTDAYERADYRLVGAHTLFTDPQVAAVGMGEKELRRDRVPYVSARYDFAEHGKAQCLAKTKGFVKMMAHRITGKILGACVIGPQGSELIHEVIVAMNFDATVDQFMRIPHLHPTLAEIWTYPAEACAAQLGVKAPGDEQVELSTSVAGAAHE
ncbi:MAG: dihydrolipoyl dehydrogenase [Candidatus Eremiobacteraeota bacterium]|nr:dihydrolipoyl dehydrogenase [Candidatus Eremiobacteraeota bacterium]